VNPNLAMLAGAALIGTAAIFVNLTSVAPTVAAFWRVGFGGGLLLLWLLTGRRGRVRVSARGHAWLFLAAVFFALDLWFWHRAIRYLGPGLATLMANLQVFGMALAGTLIYRERLGARFLFGLLLAVSGMWLLVGRGWSGLSADMHAGVWLGLATAGVYVGYLLSMQVAQRLPGGPRPESSVLWICVWTLPMFGALAVAEGQSLIIPSWRDLSVLLAYGAIAQVAGWLFIARAMQALPASRVGLMLLAQPTVAYLLGVLVFGKPLGVVEMVGVGLSLSGIFLGGVRR